jgi:hypothetical protein
MKETPRKRITFTSSLNEILLITASGQILKENSLTSSSKFSPEASCRKVSTTYFPADPWIFI